MEAPAITIEAPVAEVRGCTLADRAFLVESFLALLKTAESLSSSLSLAANRLNAERFFDDVIAPAIERGDPVLVASVRNTPIGAIFWTAPDSLYHLRWRVAAGHGVYVKAHFRNRGIASMLRQEAERMLRARGIECVEGITDHANPEGIASATKDGFMPVASVVRKFL